MNRYEYQNDAGDQAFLEIGNIFSPPNILSLPDAEGMYETFTLVGSAK